MGGLDAASLTSLQALTTKFLNATPSTLNPLRPYITLTNQLSPSRPTSDLRNAVHLSDELRVATDREPLGIPFIGYYRGLNYFPCCFEGSLL